MKIEKLSNYDLLYMFEREIKRHHYDPCDSSERTPFSYDELLQEIHRRMKGSDTE